MLFRTLSILALVSVSSSAFAADTITCTLATLDGKQSAKAVVSTDREEGGLESDGTIDVGQYNYNFSLDIMKAAKKNAYEMQAIFYENNEVVDEVGATSFEYVPGKSEGVFFEEAMDDFDGNPIMNFSCSVE